MVPNMLKRNTLACDPSSDPSLFALGCGFPACSYTNFAKADCLQNSIRMHEHSKKSGIVNRSFPDSKQDESTLSMSEHLHKADVLAKSSHHGCTSIAARNASNLVGKKAVRNNFS